MATSESSNSSMPWTGENRTDATTNPSEQAGSKPWRILCLDGGGIKGLAELLILHRLFRTIQAKKGLTVMPLPCEYFDMIVGTSTGGLNALMLGRLKMSIDDTIARFKSLSNIIFPGKKPGLVTKGLKTLGKRAFYDGDNVRVAVQQLLDDLQFEKDIDLKESDDPPRCRVFVCATRTPNSLPVLLQICMRLSDYSCEVWEAARATSSAPLFFPPFKMKCGITVVDGAIPLNNPIREAMNKVGRIDRSREIGCIVSIGTGVTDTRRLDDKKISGYGILKTCADISINCDRVAQDFAKTQEGRSMLDEPQRYFRFDVQRNLDQIELEDRAKLDDIDTYVTAYLSQESTANEIRKCVSALMNPQRPMKCYLPRDRNPDYVADDAQLNALKQLVKNNPVVYLQGLEAPGVGRVELALRFAEEEQASSNVFWLNADQTRNFEGDINNIVTKLNPRAKIPSSLQEKVARLENELQDVTQDWLLVLAGVKDDEKKDSGHQSNIPSLRRLIPESRNGRVLILPVETSEDNTTDGPSHAGTGDIEDQKSEQNTYTVGPTYHLKLAPDDPLPFHRSKVIGIGGSAMVSDAAITNIGPLKGQQQSLACKIIHVNRESQLKYALRESEIMKHIHHPHSTKIVLTFEQHDPKRSQIIFGMLMSPRAESDLEPRLRSGADQVQRHWLACLASATAYVHDAGIVHGDIKPSNILVKDSQVYLTDFGASRRINKHHNRIMAKYPYTQKYAPMEYYKDRLSSDESTWSPYASDMFQLGCVFFEILTVLAGESIKGLRGNRPYADCLQEVPVWLQKLQRQLMEGDQSLLLPLAHTASMMECEPGKRPTSTQVLNTFRKSKDWNDACSCLNIEKATEGDA